MVVGHVDQVYTMWVDQVCVVPPMIAAETLQRKTGNLVGSRILVPARSAPRRPTVTES